MIHHTIPLRGGAICLWALIVQASVVYAQDAGSAQQRPTFGGPDNVEQQLEEDARDEDSLLDDVFFDPYFGFKERVRDTLGLGFGIDYSTALFSVSETPGEKCAGGGMVRLYGAWDLVKRGSASSGSLVYKVEHRHRYTDLAPKDLSFDFGYVGLIAPPFSDQQTRLTNLYWRHRFQDGRIVVVGGFLDTTDYVDVYALASPWLHFQNLVFSTGSATIPLPDDATFGVAGAAMVTDNLYVIGGIADTNANAADPFRSADNFFATAEHFTHVEVGWTSSQQRIIFDNVHVTFWHADEREKAQVSEGWGINYSASAFLSESFMPFVRGGLREGRRKSPATVTQRRTGILRKSRERSPGRGLQPGGYERHDVLPRPPHSARIGTLLSTATGRRTGCHAQPGIHP